MFFKKFFLILVVTVILLVILDHYLNRLYVENPNIEFGVTFSPKYAGSLGLNWKETYIDILNDLKVKNLRLPAYWDIVEAKLEDFDFSQIDFMLAEAKKRTAGVILVLGERQPRWPECHIPSWAKDLSLIDHQKLLLEFIREVVGRYKDDPTILSWQVENEPLLTSFGTGCDNPDANFLKKEVEMVRKLSDKKIILTDSGELGFWIVPMQLSDIFGTTLYRDVYDPFFGYITFPLRPYLYNLKSALTRILFAHGNQKTIIIELQTEPWSPTNNLFETPIYKQIQLFPSERFKQNVSFGKETGFDTIYLWGVEWWYWMAQNGHPEYLEYAKTIFK